MQTGSLTIISIRTTDSGLYQLQIISSNSISKKIFNVTVYSVSASEQDEKSVKEGESVTLDPGLVRQPNEVMTWYYKDIRIAEITGYLRNVCEDECKERFRDRLKLDPQTGSLIITDIRTTDSGVYKLEINRNARRNSSASCVKSFGVNVAVTFPDSGRSSAAAAGIAVTVILLLAACAAVVVIYYRKGQARREATTAAANSIRGMVVCFNGATPDFPIMKAQCASPSAFNNLRYETTTKSRSFLHRGLFFQVNKESHFSNTA